MNNRLPLHILSAATVLLFATTACTQDELAEGTLPEGEYPVVIRATGLSVEATPQAAPSTRATVDGDWQGVQDPHYWTSRDPITVSAWWPLDKADITRMPAVKVAADQSKLADFQNSDFISAENQTVKFDDPKLTFTHRTARVAIELKPGTGFTSVDGATVSLVSLSTDNGNPTAIQTYHASGNSYEALTAPQTVTAGKPFIRVELGGGNFYFRPQNDVVLEAGNRYTYTVKVNATGLTFRPQNDVVLEAGNRYKYTVKVNATGLTLEGCTIGGWTDGGGESGEAEEFQDYTYDATANTYTVYTADGLLVWNEAAQNDLSTNCILAADITLPTVAEGESNWTPIGTNDHYYSRYTGTFDGGNHTITGLTINQSGTEYVGLICHLGSGGTVKNLTLENVDITGQACVGSVVGWNDGTVAACTVSGNVMGPGNTVGGVVGFNYYGSTLIACYATCSVNSNGFGIGGVAGRNYGTMTACYHATGSVLDSEVYIGGVVGRNYDTVTACYWKNNQEQGIGDHLAGTIGETTKVDGTTVTWQTAVDAMNAALQYSEWRYELTGSNTLPTLVKNEE